MHGGNLETLLGILKIPFLWSLSLLTFLVGTVFGFFQSGSTPITLGVLSILGGIITGIIFRFLDQWNERRKEKKQDKKEDQKNELALEAKLALESANLRQEERDFFNSVITRISEQERITRLRGHALGGEVDRLRNNLLTCIQALGHQVPSGVIVFNQDLHKYLAELEELPLPPLAPRPQSLQDMHRTSSADLKKVE